MSTVKVSQDQFTSVMADAASFVQAAGPKLEKYAEYEGGLDKVASHVADRLIELGLIKVSSRTNFINDVKEAGLGGLSDAFDIAANNVGSTVPVSGGASKEASADRPKTADEIWEESFGIRR